MPTSTTDQALDYQREQQLSPFTGRAAVDIDPDELPPAALGIAPLDEAIDELRTRHEQRTAASRALRSLEDGRKSAVGADQRVRAKARVDGVAEPKPAAAAYDRKVEAARDERGVATFAKAEASARCRTEMRTHVDAIRAVGTQRRTDAAQRARELLDELSGLFAEYGAGLALEQWAATISEGRTRHKNVAVRTPFAGADGNPTPYPQLLAALTETIA